MHKDRLLGKNVNNNTWAKEFGVPGESFANRTLYFPLPQKHRTVGFIPGVTNWHVRDPIWDPPVFSFGLNVLLLTK